MTSETRLVTVINADMQGVGILLGIPEPDRPPSASHSRPAFSITQNIVSARWHGNNLTESEGTRFR
jgi:hypothetical protein